MGGRLAIGATSAAVAIFSVVLLCNFALYMAAEDRARLYSLSDAEDSMSVGASTLQGVATFNLLIRAQSFLASNTLVCRSASGTVASQLGSLVDVQREGGLTVSASSRVVASNQAADNLTTLGSFDGGVPNDLDLSILTRVAGDPGAGVSMNKTETHSLHLPARLGSLVSDCLGTLDTLSRFLASTHVSNCTTTELAPELANESGSLISAANRDGFYLSLEYTISSTAPCALDFRISIVQADIYGPAGPFSVRMMAEEIASFGR